MLKAQNEKVVVDVYPTRSTAETASVVIDTLGYDYASVVVAKSANIGSTAFANVLAVAESDDNVNYTNVTALVAGGVGGFTVPAVSTSVPSSVKLDIDCKAKKRYLRVNYTPGASAAVAITGRLSRAEVSPTTASEAGVAAWARG